MQALHKKVWPYLLWWVQQTSPEADCNHTALGPGSPSLWTVNKSMETRIKWFVALVVQQKVRDLGNI